MPDGPVRSFRRRTAAWLRLRDRGPGFASSTIGPTGRVPVAVVRESTLGSTPLHRCITNAVKRWHFPAPEGGANVVVSYPFVLRPG